MSKEFDELSFKGKCVYFKKDSSWYYYESDDDDAFPKLTDKAPPLAVESYNYAKERYERTKRTGIIYN